MEKNKKEEIEEWHDTYKVGTKTIISHVFTTLRAAKKISKIMLEVIKEEEKIKVSWNVIFESEDYKIYGKAETINERAWRIALIIARASKVIRDLQIMDGFHSITGMDRLILVLQRTRGSERHNDSRGKI